MKQLEKEINVTSQRSKRNGNADDAGYSRYHVCADK